MTGVLVFRSWLCSSLALEPHRIYLLYHSIVCSVISVKTTNEEKIVRLCRLLPDVSWNTFYRTIKSISLTKLDIIKTSNSTTVLVWSNY